MVRKWEWLREYCKRQGFGKSAETADQIDRVLCYLYGDVDTKEWREYIEKGIEGIREVGETRLGVKGVEIEIVSNSEFCIACGPHPGCEGCRFGELTGNCGSDDSLFAGFLGLLRCELWCSMI